MKTADLAAWLKQTIEPLPDRIRGDRYRASVVLRDGTHLPCVLFQSEGQRVELALRRFEALRDQSAQYRMVVKSFVTSGSRLANWEIASVKPSPFAWPLATLQTIHGETIMSWTAFVVEMRDGSLHSYGTTFSFEFFDLPPGYTYEDIAQIHSGMVYSSAGGMEPFSLPDGYGLATYREKPYFTCYLPEL